MNIVGWVLNRIRQFGNRFSGTFGGSYKVMYAGTIVKMTYSNYKHDPNPLIFVLYSGIKYTDGLNLNYLNFQEKQYLGRLIYALKRGNHYAVILENLRRLDRHRAVDIYRKMIMAFDEPVNFDLSDEK